MLFTTIHVSADVLIRPPSRKMHRRPQILLIFRRKHEISLAKKLNIVPHRRIKNRLGEN